jgi:hypothetical protein
MKRGSTKRIRTARQNLRAVTGLSAAFGLALMFASLPSAAQQWSAARLARPNTPRTWRPKRPRLNIFAQHQMLMAAFPRPQPRAEDIPIYNGRGCTLLQRARMHATRAQPDSRADQQRGRRGLLLRAAAGDGGRWSISPHSSSASGSSRFTAHSEFASRRLQYRSGSAHRIEARPAVQAATRSGSMSGFGSRRSVAS